MENVYQQNVETSMNDALIDVTYYLFLGLLVGFALEAIMPDFNEEKDGVGLLLEIFAQITLIVFAFMMISSRGGGRNGVIVFIIVLVGSQPTLLQKINEFRIKVTQSSSTTNKSLESDPSPPSGATSINKLPKSES